MHSENFNMPQIPVQEPQHRKNDVREEFVPGAMPVEPDDDPFPVPITDDPEEDGELDPDEDEGLPGHRTRHPIEVATCH